MKSKLKNIASNPYIQSAFVGTLVTLMVYFVWDAPITRYKVKIAPFEHNGPASAIHWHIGDFNGDGNSERIRCFNGVDSKAMDVVHYDENGNLTEHYHFTGSEWSYYLIPGIFDLNNDGSKELFFFTTRNDSIFFNIVNPLNFEIIVDHLYFNSFERIKDNYAYRSEFLHFGDFDNDGNNELFFTFDAGFGLYPRGIFKLDFPSLKFSSSNTEYMSCTNALFKDFDHDGTPELVASSYAPCNLAGIDNPRYSNFTDTISYIAAFDYNLNPLFRPISFPYSYSSSYSIPSPSRDKLFYSLLFGRSNSDEPLTLRTINKSGTIISEKSWPDLRNPEDLSVSIMNINNVPYLLIEGIGHFKLTPKLDLLPDVFLPNMNNPTTIHNAFDLNMDGYDEWIYINSKSKIVIYNEVTKEELIFDAPIPITNELKIFGLHKNNKKTEYMVDTGSGFFFFSYQRNNRYYILYLIYLSIFIGTCIPILLILYLQKQRIEKKWHTERQLSELQFNAVKNQLNPHFLFNTLNSVAFMINEGRNDEAYDFLALNSRMIQRVMNDAKEVKRPLKDEIQFTKDYIRIQKHRFKDRFDTEFIVHPDVDDNMEVPKMCIHTYIENAIKHGFRNTKEGGQLSVYVEPIVHGILITISDNGMGRKAASAYKDSSGNGISVMNDFYQLFEKYHGYKIDLIIEDIQPTGTIIKLTLKLQQ